MTRTRKINIILLTGLAVFMGGCSNVVFFRGLYDGTQHSCDIGCDVILHVATFFMLLSLVPISLILWLRKEPRCHRSTIYLELAIGPIYIASLCLFAILFINSIPWGGHEKLLLLIPIWLCLAIAVRLWRLYKSHPLWDNNYLIKKLFHWMPKFRGCSEGPQTALYVDG